MDSPVAIAVGTGSRRLFENRAREELWLPVNGLSVPLLRVRAGPRDVLVLPRHGQGHAYPPHEIPHHRHALALKKMGVSAVVGISAVGSLREGIRPTHAVVLDDFIGYREAPSPSLPGPFRASQGHMALDHPYCAQVRKILLDALAEYPAVVPSGTYLEVRGPRFETPAEIRAYAGLGADVVGMTGVQELLACRMAGLCYGAVACVTNMAAGLALEPPHHDRIEEIMSVVLEVVGPALLSAASRAATLGACCQATT